MSRQLAQNRIFFWRCGYFNTNRRLFRAATSIESTAGPLSFFLSFSFVSASMLRLIPIALVMLVRSVRITSITTVFGHTITNAQLREAKNADR